MTNLMSDALLLALIKQAKGSQYTVDGRKVWGILRTEYARSELGELSIEGNVPTLEVLTSDVIGVGHGAVVEGGPKPYLIREIEPDGEGMTMLHLREGGP